MINLAPEQLNIIQQILANYVPDYEVRAFGSRVSGNIHRFSDLDLVLVGEKPLELYRMAYLRDAFEESQLPFRIDLLDWNYISDNFKKIIEQKFIVINPL